MVWVRDEVLGFSSDNYRGWVLTQGVKSMSKVCSECGGTESGDWYRVVKGDKSSPSICNKCYMKKKNAQKKSEDSVQMRFSGDGKLRKIHLTGIDKTIESEYFRASRIAKKHKIPICDFDKFREFSLNDPDLERRYQQYKDGGWKWRHRPRIKHEGWDIGFVPDNMRWTNQEVLDDDIAYQKTVEERKNIGHSDTMKPDKKLGKPLSPEMQKWLEEQRRTYKI